MYKNKTVAVVILCYNEEMQISDVIASIPLYIDRIIVVDDASTDNTFSVANSIKLKNNKVTILSHDKNQGCGGALATGYKYVRDNNIDIAVRMDGDGQMLSRDLELIIDPVASGRSDYTKGNRLFSGEAYKEIPKIRYFGNSILSLLTKVASGYWNVADSQSGYTAINLKALKALNWSDMYKRYGQPNHLLIMLNVYNFKVKDVIIKPTYGVGEKSNMKISKVIFTIGWLIIKGFFWRIKEKYIIRDFHPLVFFYLLGILFGVITLSLFIRLFYIWIETGYIRPINSLALMFSFMSSSLFSLFAMWFDMEENKKNIGK
jgi:glycosyltransferase involved in cell wall biosynthesis